MRTITLYHRTSPEAADAIVAARSWTSREHTGEVYLSTAPDGQAVGYGPAVLRVEVPRDRAHLDDEFPDGEQHYRVRASALAGRKVTRLA